jgi:pimeloyl-ACP methyl ester carboxylesterase
MDGKKLALGLSFLLLLAGVTSVGSAGKSVPGTDRDSGPVIKRGYVEIAEGQVHYRTMGSGPVVMLMHQVVRSSDEYRRVMPVLARKYRVVAMDMLGFGESDKPPRQYSIPDHGRSVISFMDAMGIDKASFAGHHTGAKVSVEVAATNPQRVEKMVLSALPYGYIKKEDEPMAEIYRPLEVKADGSHLERIWNEQSGGPEASLDVRYEITLEYLKAGPRGEEGHYAAKHYSRLIDDRLRLIPDRIKASTLLLCGREDKWIEGLDALTKLMPQSQIFIIEGSGTGTDIIRRSPQAFAEAVLKFLSQP